MAEFQNFSRCLNLKFFKGGGTRDGFGSTKFEFESCGAWNEVWVFCSFLENFKMMLAFDGGGEDDGS